MISWIFPLVVTDADDKGEAAPIHPHRNLSESISFKDSVR